MRWSLVVALVACGGSPEPTAPARTAAVASAIATPAGADDVLVAQVNGRPVWGSCVAAQVRRGARTREAALDECIAFELLAQEADARGYATLPEIVDETRTALVDRLVETGFEDRYRTPADLRDVLAAHVERNQERLQRPEVRASAFVRIEVPKDAPPGSEDLQRVKTLADKLAAKLAGERGLTPHHLDAAAQEVFGTQPFKFEKVRHFPRDGLVPTYADALFAIPEPGRVAPNAVRTEWGWDVILLDDILPAKTYTREEAARESFPEVRRAYFQTWVNQIVRSLGVKITVDPKLLEADA